MADRSCSREQVGLADVEELAGVRIEQAAAVSGFIVAAFQRATAQQQGAELIESHEAMHNFTGKLSQDQLMGLDEFRVAKHGKPS